MVKSIPLWLRLLAGVFVILTGLLLLAPLIVVVGVSVSESQFIAFPPNGLSLRWYAQVLSSNAYLTAGWISIQIAILVTILATLVGGAAAIAIQGKSQPQHLFHRHFSMTMASVRFIMSRSTPCPGSLPYAASRDG